MINGLAASAGVAIESARQSGPFLSIDDFTRRTALGQAVVKRLAEADAFGSLGTNRRQALWQSLEQEKKPRAMPLFAAENNDDAENRTDPSWVDSGGNPPGQDGRAMYLPPMPLQDEVVADYRSAGLSLRAHPISFYRRELARLGITSAEGLVELTNGASVRVAGLVLLRQRPSTAKGITFVTLEDETGTVNLVVHQRTWDHFYRIARRAPAWIARGYVQTTADATAAVIHVVVNRLESLGEQLAALGVRSRDFR
jgi:error-prone DNA polymerase